MAKWTVGDAHTTDDGHEHTPDEVLAWRSIRYRTAAGWLVVSIIAVRYLIHPLSNIVLVAQGHEPLAPVPDLSLVDVAAIVGLPVSGSFADKMTGDTE
jgi:hypothetical protein